VLVGAWRLLVGVLNAPARRAPARCAVSEAQIRRSDEWVKALQVSAIFIAARTILRAETFLHTEYTP
jgi:hypothetical protein